MLFKRAVVLLAGLCTIPCLAVAQPYGECDVSQHPIIRPMDTRVPDAVTVAVPLPATGAYNGNTPETINGGYMYCLAAEIAWRAGGKKVLIKNASFESIITGKAADYDFSIYDIIATPARAQVVDFSGPYRVTDTGVLVRPDTDLNQDSIRTAVVGALMGSAQERFVKETNLVDPARLRLFQSNDDMWLALRSRQIDAVLNDTTVVMRAARRLSLKVIGRYPAGGAVAIVFPKGSPNVAPVNQMLTDMRQENLLHAINAQWLYPGNSGGTRTLPQRDAQRQNRAALPCRP